MAVALSLHPAPPPSAPVHTARLHLARIRLTEEGVPTAQHTYATDMCVPLVVRLEPLVFGVLPASVLPIAATLLVVLAAAACCVLPPVLRVVEDVVETARKELRAAREAKDKVSAAGFTRGDVGVGRFYTRRTYVVGALAPLSSSTTTLVFARS